MFAIYSVLSEIASTDCDLSELSKPSITIRNKHRLEELEKLQKRRSDTRTVADLECHAFGFRFICSACVSRTWNAN
jgi:hypothetical protein